ncbi:hypothetical protein [Bergeyella sp. RCAD1439]|uniref:hypothetical protein n=1 Tax=Bergeyella anatis TaxID=3113737 RepID=UPI002E190904|nr:hypothetical protein [Bergeyella sp. RCAD1439]
MRLSNRSKSGTYGFINTVLLMVLASGVALFVLNEFREVISGWSRYLLLAVPFLLWSIFYFRGRQIFEYDSDGEALNFKNRSVRPSLWRPLSDEFPKYKLADYTVVDGVFFRHLYVVLSSRKAHGVRLKYDVSYLSVKELGDLKYSLSKIVKENREQNTSTDQA